MTHVELLSRIDRGSHLLLACPGELRRLPDAADRVYSTEAPRGRVVEHWTCPACGHFLSVSEGVLLNDYPPPGRFTPPAWPIERRN